MRPGGSETNLIAAATMEKAHELRQPLPPIKPGTRKLMNRAVVPPRGAFSAQMLGPPRTPTFSDSPVPEEDDEFSYDYAFVTSRRASNEGNQALSPPPPPPPPLHPSSKGVRRPMVPRTVAPMPQSSSVQSLASGQASLRTAGAAKSKHALQSLKSNNDDRPGYQSTDKPTPSVHPIDTLSKKLRQQAMELTHVYEELEKQNLQIDEYRQQLQDQKHQLEQLRVQRRKSIDSSSRPSTSSRTGAVQQQKRAAQMMIGTPSTGASLGQKRGELDRKLKEAEREKKKYELAAKRIEKALLELQVFQNDRIDKLHPFEGTSNQGEDDATASGDFAAVLNEQRAYIRVLEEAVHLKATDFEVTGHEELLIVLAELRHTIYEQEKDVEQKSNQLSSAQEQLEHEQNHHLATKNHLLASQKQQNDLTNRFHEQEFVLHAQLNEAQKQLQQRDDHLSQLQGVSADARRSEETLQNRLAAAMKAQNLSEAKLEDATRSIKTLQEQLESTSMKYEEAALQTANLREECAKKQSHLDEMNALQEELLGSVDKYVSKVKKSRDKVERLEAELQSVREKESLAQKKSDDAVQAALEQVAALQAKLDAAKHLEQQLKAQCTALEQMKNQLESTLTEVQQSLQGQIEDSNIHQLEITAKEQKCHQVEETVAELEAALSTALLMMLENPDQQVPVEDETDSTEADEHSFLLDQFVLRELHTCCQALGTLGNGPTHSLCPSFPEIVARVATIGERVLQEVTRALASWSRERTNLVEACATLDSIARMCQDEMEKRHEEIGDYRQQLAERTSEVEAFGMQVDALEEQLRSAEAECEAYHALEQHTTNQEKALEAKQALILDLSTENDRLAAVENAYSIQVATNARYSERLEDQQEAMKEQRRYADELECALENAAIFAELQNGCNQQVSSKNLHATPYCSIMIDCVLPRFPPLVQLNTQFVHAENVKREQAEHIKALEVQNSAFSNRFVALIKQYTSFLRRAAATSRNLQEHLSLFDAEIQNGDVLRLLQLFPALLEEYISTCSNNAEQEPPCDARELHWKQSTPICSVNPTQKKKPRRVVGWSTEKPHDGHVEMATHSPTHVLKTSSPLEVAVTRRSALAAATQKEEAQLAEQLELIRGAFQSFKEDMETQR